MNYQEALDYIHGTYKFGSKLGLENIKYLLSLLGDPHKKLKIIHVAGTNGKGSTSSYIHSILKEAGYRVGLYTSPYLEEFTERMRINGENIPKDKLANITAIVKEKIEGMVNEGKNHPTEFEVVTAIAFYYYAKENIDFLVLEVGLGGRLDATNVVEDPLLSVITPIGLDHTEYLGDTLDKIAYEKGGIIKENSLVLSYPQEAEVIDVFRNLCAERNSKLFVTSFNELTIHKSTIEEQVFSVNILGNVYDNIKIQLVGIHQIYNACTAIGAVEVLRKYRNINISDEAVLGGLYNAKWPGRFEVLQRDPVVIIDGAHNLHGAEALRKSIGALLKDYKITFVIGMLQDKDVEGVLKDLIPLMSKIIATRPANPRAMNAIDLADKLKVFGKETYVSEDIKEAINMAIEETEANEAIIFAGSLYMIGEVRKLLIK
ncbi:bifunctional folylpolyglutamate synthase/dihydrofolate synthase [Alkaliphilus sp. B6464]|uniref:bifunctional folylpolyglutamate synthase/dihydrofolate synthase n=1 Tax=Alkaliphilus sp. B6464 TaxID=2731219 RepID=UPI001BA493AF|nr:folylpolyglutamate synthase/dihydrofolate synthase family protein [Alkaliphilus sp. B6464]QUH20197.1 bifunctional folylpolyglutamate synthase/dihydrofolate synthase [Alkaliphilus sp. B6464]